MSQVLSSSSSMLSTANSNNNNTRVGSMNGFSISNSSVDFAVVHSDLYKNHESLSVHESSDIWDECNSMLQNMMYQYNDSKTDTLQQQVCDDIHEIMMYPQKMQTDCNNYLKNEIEPLKGKIDNKIEEEKKRIRYYKDEMKQLQQQMEELLIEQQNHENELILLQQQETTMRNEINEFNELAVNEICDMETHYDDSKIKISRLRQQLSLYSNVTGIKWDYEKENMLAGQIKINSKQMIKYFEIDPSDKSHYEIANELWNLISENVADELSSPQE